MNKIKWPLQTNSDTKINLVADKVNELVEAYNLSLAPGCEHATAYQLKNGTWYCPECKKFIKPPHG